MSRQILEARTYAHVRRGEKMTLAIAYLILYANIIATPGRDVTPAICTHTRDAVCAVGNRKEWSSEVR